jgi:hypothetical protein
MKLIAAARKWLRNHGGIAAFAKIHSNDATVWPCEHRVTRHARDVSRNAAANLPQPL